MKTVFTIEENREIARQTWLMRLGCATMPEMHSGQFVDIALDGFFLRRPISVCDLHDGSLVLCYKTVGAGTRQMSLMQPGERLELLTGLGNGFDLSKCSSSALLAGGGLGAAPMLLLCRELLQAGKKVSVVLGFNTADEIILEEEFGSLGVQPAFATMDGSRGTKGFVTDAIRELAPEYDSFFCCGPMPMMKAVCEALPVNGQASLEERMGCGAGFCYGCSRMMKSGAKRICKDGPVFDKEEIIW